MNEKKLHIGENHSVKEVQDEFSRAYPFLKIEFYDKTYGYRRMGTANPLYVPRQEKDKSNRLGSPDAPIELSDPMTVSELEKKLHDQFGLSAQVFRKSGNLWMETTRTDHWTLKAQNEHGREISAFHPPEDRQGNGWTGL